MDALIRWRALFEPFDKTQDTGSACWSALLACVHPIPMRPDGASMVLVPFAGTKGLRLPGRNPAPQNITGTREGGRQRSIDEELFDVIAGFEALWPRNETPLNTG